MRRPHIKLRSLQQQLYLILSGFVIGWLVGLSVSPVVQGLITAFITLLIGAAGILAGVTSQTNAAPSIVTIDVRHGKPPILVDLKPIASIAIGVLLGSGVGLYVRTNDLLGIQPQNMINRWGQFGISDTLIAQRLFDQSYPPIQTDGIGSNSTSNRSVQMSGSLYSLPAETCGNLFKQEGDDLRAELEFLSIPVVDSLLSTCEGAKCWRSIRSILCPD